MRPPRDRADGERTSIRPAATACLSAIVLAALVPGCSEPPAPEHQVAGGDPVRGRAVIGAVGCGTCHAIPGVPGARGTVGPPLDAFARRTFIAGVAPNRPSVLIEWVRAAPDIAPGTAMPHLPLSDDQARDVAAYLYTLR